MIAERLDLPRTNVTVAKDLAYGCHPTVFATPSTAHGFQINADEVAKELRDQFDLKEQKRRTRLSAMTAYLCIDVLSNA